MRCYDRDFKMSFVVCSPGKSSRPSLDRNAGDERHTASQKLFRLMHRKKAEANSRGNSGDEARQLNAKPAIALPEF